MTNNIKHLGIVENIDGFHLKVRIVQTSACSSCSIKGHCSASETKEKLIDVYNHNPSLNPQVGQRVMITGSTSMGIKAVGWAFIMPFLILLVSLFVSMKLTQHDEVLSALVALLMLVPYYIILFLCRGHFSRTFVFTLESVG